MGVGSGLMYDVVIKRSRSLSHLLMRSCSNLIYTRDAHQVESITMSSPSCPLQATRLKVIYGIKYSNTWLFETFYNTQLAMGLRVTGLKGHWSERSETPFS